MYKINFTIEEINKFNLLGNEKIRKSIMSIYMYMLKLNEKENRKYADANLNNLKHEFTLSISMLKFLNAYVRNHTKISIRTLKKRIDKLEELQLIFVDKSTKNNVYSFCRFCQVNEKVNEKVNDENTAQTTETTDVDDCTEKHKSLNSQNDLDVDFRNNSYKKTTNLNFDNSQYRKIEKWSDISELLFNTFKDLKIRSNRIRAVVIDKIEKNLNNITVRFAKNYIYKVILQVKIQEERRRIAYAKSIKINFEAQKQDTFNNFEQRSYNFDELEKNLLGWA